MLSNSLPQKKALALPSLTSQPHQVLASDLVPYSDVQQVIIHAHTEDMLACVVSMLAAFNISDSFGNSMRHVWLCGISVCGGVWLNVWLKIDLADIFCFSLDTVFLFQLVLFFYSVKLWILDVLHTPPHELNINCLSLSLQVSKIAAYAYSAISQIKVDAKEELVVQFAIPWFSDPGCILFLPSCSLCVTSASSPSSPPFIKTSCSLCFLAMPLTATKREMM